MRKKVHHIEYRNESKEELLPDFSPDFPYISSCAELDQCLEGFIPWHWHKEVELFYMENGSLEYYTPGGVLVFPAGSGGLINSNVLHMTKIHEKGRPVAQLLHIFDPSLVGGRQGSRIEQKYVAPIVTSSQLEAIPLSPDVPEHRPVLEALRRSFQISDSEYAYEIRLRSALSAIWSDLLPLAEPMLREKAGHDKANDQIKAMMIYIHEHFSEKLPVARIAASAYISERECYRAFHDCLHTTPAEYLRSYRLQTACHMLAESQESLTFIAQACGLGNSSNFGKIFKEQMDCTPSQYRRKWQDRDMHGQE